MEKQSSETCDEYLIIKDLGEGASAKVKLAVGPDHRLVAIKRFKDSVATTASIVQELQVMKELKHDDVLELFDVRESALWVKPSGEKFNCYCIIMEYAGGGELFDFIAIGSGFPENMTRALFLQLIQALQYIHSQSIVHRDIKPENLMLTSDFKLKLGDFGYATRLAGGNPDTVLHTKLGTEGYMAPEIMACNYNGILADIFSSGVVLFIMLAGHPPFERSLITDPYYRLIKQKNYETFWNAHSKRKPAGFFSESFKKLFTSMVAFKPEERPIISQIQESDWCKQESMNQQQLQAELLRRKDKIEEEKKKKREEMQRKKNLRKNALLGRSNAAYRDVMDIVFDFFLESYCQEVDKHRELCSSECKPSWGDLVVREEKEFFFSSLFTFLNDPIVYKPEDSGDTPFVEFRAEVEDKLTEVASPPLFNNSSKQIYLTFTYEVQNMKNVVAMKLLPTQYGKCLSIKFVRLSGSLFYYKWLVQTIKTQFCYCEAPHEVSK